jgi:two-component system CheB/CheR fusion protein
VVNDAQSSAPKRQETPSSSEDLFVVGIGASAGGLRALRDLLGSLPANPGFACVVVVHLSPDHESHLPELLQPATPMPIQQVTETVPLERNRVYVIPPNANLDTIDTHLRLSALERRRLERAPIDHFLRTLAATHDGKAVAVILTGTGSDGSLGLARIKECGGLTIAQDPEEAEYDAMPRNAIATGMVDLVMPLAEMGDSIMSFCATHPRLEIASGADGHREEDQQRRVLREIVAELEGRTNRDFSYFRRQALLRRIGKRMQLCRVDTLDEYLDLLRKRVDEAPALCRDLLISVTEFFRDAELFERLQTVVLPVLFSNKSRERVRVWSIGCSSGEEAYSLAILLLEQASAARGSPRIQVFASDLSDELLSRAREGVYPHEVAVSVSPERLERFFDEENGHYRIKREVRQLVVFADHNVFRDAPYAHLDLIVCRGLLSDLEPNARQAVLATFYYALGPHGWLVVGPDDRVDEPLLFEQGGDSVPLFRRVEGALFRRVDASLLGAPTTAWTDNGFDRRPRLNSFASDPSIRETLGLSALHARLLQAYSPPSVLLSAADSIVHYSPRSNRQLLVPGGELTHDVFKLLHAPLRSLLRSALERARCECKPQSTEPVLTEGEHGPCRLIMHVEPPSPETADLTLVVFEELPIVNRRELDREVATTSAVTIAELQADIAGMQRRMQSLIQMTSTDRQDLNQANEALQSSNEELKFLLEALESSKEELQAANEELTTLDRENRRRVAELAELSGDLRHLLESTGIATLFVDRDLKIVRFTPQLGDLFNVRPADVGRSITDVTHGLSYTELADDVRRTLDDHAPIEREVAGVGGRWYLTRILPYRTSTQTVDGAVVTLVDITDRKCAELELREANRRKDEFLALLAHELRNPLAPISAGIEVLNKAGGRPEIVAEVSATMARQAKQLVRLVDDLLELSRVSGGRLRLRTSRLLLCDVVRDAVAAVKPLMERYGHELSVDLGSEPIVLEADGARLTQVIANLLNNAARYTPAGGRIEVTVRGAGAEAVITVTDNGVGMPSGVLARVFEMFYQGDDPRLPRPAGLGIGLTLAKSLVEMHGGTIAVDSAGPNRGSRFTVRLPMLEAQQTPLEREGLRETAELGGHRVLIVDDNTDAAATLGMLVETLGRNEVHVATNGPDALRIAAERRPDIVLLDLKMPGMDGYEVARRLRSESWGGELMLVAVTGWALDEHKRRTHEAGFDRHLTKPADVASLEAVLAARGQARDVAGTAAH